MEMKNGVRYKIANLLVVIEKSINYTENKHLIDKLKIKQFNWRNKLELLDKIQNV